MMNDFLIEDDHTVQSGLCLFEAFDDLVFLANIDFLEEDNTIGEYIDWRRNEMFENAIDLTHPGFNPQRFSYRQIDKVSSFKFLYNKAKRHLRKDEAVEGVDLTEEKFDYKGARYNFRGILTRLWNTEGSLYDYDRTVEDYFKNLIKVKAKEVVENNDGED